ncbi:zinc transporter ZntB [Motiliproteus sp. MSK22-1]|uniref:zinc transporter ZntB n=1 Tax=Motiliproteus sp. MSK22-1 TaxID=1897630 RepID=UPI0009789E64|nr:zinc transporter ZntB [Motiliproteus sp. MSK22-1]OMH26271.1 magnesium transporter CorA [Motiliproteus sp. MSK22-1]
MTSDGLVYGYIFDGKGGGRSIEWGDISGWCSEQGILWLHFEYVNERVQNWIQNESLLEPLVVDALLMEESRPRVTQLKDSLLVALRGVNLSPGSNPEDMVGIRIWSDGQRIISTRKRRLLSAGDIALQLDRGEGPCSAGEFLVMLTDGLIVRMKKTIEETEDQVAAIEDMVLSNESYALRSRISSLRREVISLRRYLAPQREAMMQLLSFKISWMNTNDWQNLREVADHLTRYVEELDSVRDRAAVSQEELANRLAEQMNNRMYVLSLVAAVFLPLGFLTGLLGINVGGIPGAENPLSFWIFVFILVFVVVLQYWLFKLKKWL